MEKCLLLLLLAGSCLCAWPQENTPAEVPAPPLIGAIRWDGWFSDNPWQKNLDPAQWHERLPFYGKMTEAGKAEVCADSQEVMSREIAAARAGGIAYWAFCYYHPKSWPDADKYNYGWRRFLAAPDKGGLRFCLLLQGGSHLGPPEDWPETVNQFVAMFKDPAYQHVCGGRPLVYLYSGEKLFSHFKTAEAAAGALDLLRRRSVEEGAGNPHLVAQIWPHLIGADFTAPRYFDAISAYSAHGGDGQGLPYAKLAESNRWYWDQFKAAGREVVPLVNAGWDGRPRQYPGVWFLPPTPAELAANLRGAFDWIRANPGTAKADTVLVYAWNEHDEGGWLCPTTAEGAARLDAIRAMADAWRSPAR